MIVSIIDLWLPIVVGTVLAWISSGLIHMALKYHNGDYRQLANENEVMTAIKNGSPQLGVYSMPHCLDMNEMKTDAMQQRFAEGPVGFVAILPTGMPNMGKLMGLQVAHFLIGCALVAYCASLALAPGADYLTVFRFVTTTAFLTFGWAVIPYSIWYGHTWSTAAKYLLDALIYAALIGGSFAWLWPAPA